MGTSWSCFMSSGCVECARLAGKWLGQKQWRRPSSQEQQPFALIKARQQTKAKRTEQIFAIYNLLLLFFEPSARFLAARRLARSWLRAGDRIVKGAGEIWPFCNMKPIARSLIFISIGLAPTSFDWRLNCAHRTVSSTQTRVTGAISRVLAGLALWYNMIECNAMRCDNK